MDGGRRRRAAVVAALVLVAGACADDGGDPVSAPSTAEEQARETTTTDAVPTTSAAEPTTTRPEPASTSSTTTTVTGTTEPRQPPYWTEVCEESPGDPDASYTSDARLEEFTTLGAEPTLDLLVPEVVTSVGPYGSVASTAPIPGGVLIGVYPPDSWPIGDDLLYSSSLTAVDHDGTIRWRRCFDDIETRSFAVAPASLAPDVAWGVSTSGNQPFRIVGVDLVTGADVELEADVSGLGERGGGSGRFVVLGPPLGSGPIGAEDVLVVVDALDGTATEIPVPPSWVGVDGAWVQVLDDDPSDDDLVLADDFPIGGETAAVFVDGAWTEDPAAQRASLPLQVTETFGEPYELRLFDGSGRLVWSVPDFHGIGREGFHWAVADDVVVAMRCLTLDADGFCGWVDGEPPREELVGFDLATGQELWSLPGPRAVPVVAGNEAVVSDWDEATGRATGYSLVDLVTGDRIGPDGGSWPVDAFAQECCGGDVYVNVHREGGIVIATDEDHVRVWYPPELTTPTASVDVTGASAG